MTGVLIREVSIRRDEFMRQLPDAAGDYDYDVDGNTVTLKDGEKRIEIKLVYEGKQPVGAMDLPVHQIHFMFENMSDEQARAFMEYWDSQKLRMGGG